MNGPDFEKGVDAASIAENKIELGHAFNEEIILTRKGDHFFAFSAHCTHYHGPLAEGVLQGDEIRCPWHHARFNIKSGCPVAPALNPLPCWRVETKSGRVFVTGRINEQSSPSSVVVIGGGAAGSAAVEMLRRESYLGPVTMITSDVDLPYDRPNLSKDYLAGTAPEEWIPLRGPDFYEEKKIDVLKNATVTAIDTKAKEVKLSDGKRVPYGVLLLATGAAPVKLTIPGSDLPHVHYLRTLADSRKLIEAAKKVKSAAIIGASFIGLEAAAALKARGLEVSVIGREERPLERIFGPEVADLVRDLHVERGVNFHLYVNPEEITPQGVRLNNGKTVESDLVIVGIGVRPNIQLAEQAGLKTGNGVVVDAFLQTSEPGIFAAGDIANFPSKLTGEHARVEHWVVAQRQGQIAALNMLGRRITYDDIPFFWSQHYDTRINSVGHPRGDLKTEISGSIDGTNFSVGYWADKRKIAVASVGDDLDNLKGELELERSLQI